MPETSFCMTRLTQAIKKAEKAVELPEKLPIPSKPAGPAIRMPKADEPEELPAAPSPAPVMPPAPDAADPPEAAVLGSVLGELGQERAVAPYVGAVGGGLLGQAGGALGSKPSPGWFESLTPMQKILLGGGVAGGAGLGAYGLYRLLNQNKKKHRDREEMKEAMCKLAKNFGKLAARNNGR